MATNLTMFQHTLDGILEIQSVEGLSGDELFKVLDANRVHVGQWHPWVNALHSVEDTEKLIVAWRAVNASQHGLFNGVWLAGQLVGMVNYAFIDGINRWAAMSYWLDEGHQRRGIITSCCRVLIGHGFDTLNLNRITIECAVENARSRAIPERLGFKEEGILQQIEWLGDHYVDHAIYGLLKANFVR